MKKIMQLLLVGLLTAGIITITAGSPKSAKPLTTMRLYGLNIGGVPYTMSHALGEIVNKHSDWLRIDVMEGMSSSANVGVLQNQAERRTDSFIFTNSLSNGDARGARAPFKKPYLGGRFIATFMPSMIGLYTTNPAIKTIADIKGHSAHFAGRGTSPARIFTEMLKNEGILDQVNVSYGSFADMKDAIINGLVDVAWSSSPGVIGIGTAPAAHYVEAYSARKLSFVYFSQEQLEKAIAGLGYKNIQYLMMPANQEFPGQAEHVILLHDNGWWADETMDEAAVYELTRMIVEHLGEFASYHKLGEFLRSESIAWAPINRELVHPGALRYYQEHNIPVGLEAKLGK